MANLVGVWQHHKANFSTIVKMAGAPTSKAFDVHVDGIIQCIRTLMIGLKVDGKFVQSFENRMQDFVATPPLPIYREVDVSQVLLEDGVSLNMFKYLFEVTGKLFLDGIRNGELRTTLSSAEILNNILLLIERSSFLSAGSFAEEEFCECLLEVFHEKFHKLVSESRGLLVLAIRYG